MSPIKMPRGCYPLNVQGADVPCHGWLLQEGMQLPVSPLRVGMQGRRLGFSVLPGKLLEAGLREIMVSI